MDHVRVAVSARVGAVGDGYAMSELATLPAVRGAEGRLVDERPGDEGGRAVLATLLQSGAAIEHALMVQYLYAAYAADVVIASGKFPDAATWQQQLLVVAREEMGHLMTIQNALRLIGAAPNWNRDEIPSDSKYYPFPLQFEPFTFLAIEKYVYAEMDPLIDHQPPPGRPVPPWRKDWDKIRKRIDDDVSKATNAKAHHVGTLFRVVLDRMRDPLTDERWFDPNTYAQQASWDAWGKGYRPHPLDADLDDPDQPPNVIVAQMGTRTEAIDSLVKIAGQGEAPHLRHPRTSTPSHFDRFMVVYDGIVANSGVIDQLVKNLPTNPTTNQQFEGDDGTQPIPRTYISDPTSRALARLSDLRYLMLLTNLGHAHINAASPDAAVRATGGYLLQRSFADMFNVKTLAGLLFRAPLTADPKDPRRAGPPFELPAKFDVSGSQRELWSLQAKLTDASKQLCDNLLASGAPGNSVPYLRTLRDLDIRDKVRIEAILKALPPSVRDGS